MLIIFIRAIILYIVVVFSIRLMGKRQLGELQPSEFVIAILISNIATLPAEDTEIPLVRGIIPILTLVCLDVIMSSLSLKSRKIRRLMSGSPKIIISHGKIDQKQLKNLRYTVDDLMESLRGQGIFDISQVEFAIVETTGKISFFQKQPHQPLTPATLRHCEAVANPPQTVIDDGKIIDASLEAVGMTRKQLDIVLERNDISPQEIFLMTTDGKGKNVIVKKEESA